MSKRVKVNIEHRKKLFYTNFLNTWKNELSSDDKQIFTINKAYRNIKQHPLEVDGIADLKKINGVGEVIAVRCDAAWNIKCSDSLSDLSLQEVKQIGEDEYRKLFNSTRNAKKKSAEEKKQKKNTPRKRTSQTQEDEEFNENVPKKYPHLQRQASLPNIASSSSSIPRAIPNIPLPSRSIPSDEFNDSDDDINPVKSNSNIVIRSNTQKEIRYSSCQPFDHPEIILIADCRENNGRARNKTVVEHLENLKGEHRVEHRAITVGDYLWIARKIDGTEVVLDWVVERKTWDDLNKSIMKGRYEDQKQRLHKVPIHNKVYLIEGHYGGMADAKVKAEQALMTTTTRDNFMIQRCISPHETAKFLLAISSRLKNKSMTQQLTGIIFEDLQILAEKTKAESVTDTWLRQLTVCPGMSIIRAQAVVQRFPSFSSLSALYSSSNDDPSLLLHKAVPSVNKALSTQMALFFKKI